MPDYMNWLELFNEEGKHGTKIKTAAWNAKDNIF